jgi:translation initiation factor IF-3|tara:strand:+ start:857 stop:1366 length:510 start_codon:yes stop_codon:yes gene_type:complete
LNRKPLVNNQIRAREVRLIDETGKQLGVIELEKALKEAQERNLDLIQVTDKVQPPICKMMDYGKYLYREEKKRKKSQKQTGGDLKTIRLGFNISDHDLEMRVNQAEKFLKQGNKVRIELKLRGREKALQGFAREKISKFLNILENKISHKTEKNLKKEMRGLTMIISKQ